MGNNQSNENTRQRLLNNQINSQNDFDVHNYN